jgi:hypothetical protein
MERAFAQGDVAVMDAFFQQMCKEYYNSKGIQIPGEAQTPTPKPIKKAKQPPVLEQGGNGNQTPRKSADPSALRKMNTDAQAQWLIDMGIV